MVSIMGKVSSDGGDDVIEVGFVVDNNGGDDEGLVVVSGILNDGNNVGNALLLIGSSETMLAVSVTGAIVGGFLGAKPCGLFVGITTIWFSIGDKSSSLIVGRFVSKDCCVGGVISGIVVGGVLTPTKIGSCVGIDSFGPNEGTEVINVLLIGCSVPRPAVATDGCGAGIVFGISVGGVLNPVSIGFITKSGASVGGLRTAFSWGC